MMEDGKNKDRAKEVQLPEGFQLVSLQQLLGIVWVAIVSASSIALSGPQNFPYILVPVIVILFVAILVIRRKMRKFLKECGDVEITMTFSYSGDNKKKNVLLRDVGEFIYAGIDRILDGKDKDGPQGVLDAHVEEKGREND